MSSSPQLSADVVEQIRNNPLPTVLFDLGHAAIQFNVHRNPEFKKLISYLMELADGRDRREPWVHKPGVARPVPKLRVAVDSCFEMYGDLQWFKLNKTTNQSGQPLLGMFPRMAASIARVDNEDFGLIVEALTAPNPDAALLKMLQERKGRVAGVGVGLFSQLASAFRRDLYFAIPREWGEQSGATKFIDNDLRKYIALARVLRQVCDQLNIGAEIRGGIFDKLINADRIHPALQQALSKALGPTLARFTVLEPNQALEAGTQEDDALAAEPLKFAASSIRARRGDRRLRTSLLRAYGDQCVITGASPRAILEVAYVVPFPKGNFNSTDNAILLRSDLHTLWDLNMIAVNPDTLCVEVDESLLATAYGEYAGRKITTPKSSVCAVSRVALKERWNAFRSKRPVTGERTPKPAEAAPSTVETRSREDRRNRPLTASDAMSPMSASGSFMGIRAD